MARDSMRSREVPELWYQVRKKVGDIRATLPAEAIGPFFNDEFGDTFGNIYALTGDGLRLRGDEGLRRPHPAGAAAGAGRRQGRAGRPAGREDLDRAVQHQAGHARHPAGGGAAGAGRAERGGAGRLLRDRQRPHPAARGRAVRFGGADPRRSRSAPATAPSGWATSPSVQRGFADPAAPKHALHGPGRASASRWRCATAATSSGWARRWRPSSQRLQKTLPVGMQLRKVSDQPQAVHEAVGEFVRVLAEAVAIVLLVSFFSLGLRTGLVVALSHPAGAGDDLRRHARTSASACTRSRWARWCWRWACWWTTRSSRWR